ncbi:MAG: hypothetical protein HY072_09760 [Deltaproteobacteria bacterium]|nr:hypothetical protein [Deltaproteobacteria bacterium]
MDMQQATYIDLKAEKALFTKDLKGLALAIYEDERPLKGLAGIIDFRFQRIFSYFLKSQAMTGKKGECIYVPTQKTNKTYHFILVGCGKKMGSVTNKQVMPETLESLRKNLVALGLSGIGISRADFGDLSLNEITNFLKGVPVWILQ